MKAQFANNKKEVERLPGQPIWTKRLEGIGAIRSKFFQCFPMLGGLLLVDNGFRKAGNSDVLREPLEESA